MHDSSRSSAPGGSRRASRRRSVVAVGGALVLVAVAAIVVIGMRSSSDGLAGAANKGSRSSSPAPATSSAPAPSPTGTVATEAVIGLTVDQATTWATANNYTVRVIEVDGEARMVTSDYNPNRINLVVGLGLVTSAKMG